MTPKLTHALKFALSTTWAMEPNHHRKMMDILARHASGVRLDEDELLAATGTAAPRRKAEMQMAPGGVAVIPIHGVIAQRAAAVGRLSSAVGTSVEHIRGDLQAALADPAVTSIMLDVDSPGGSVAGIEELADEIRAARDVKPIVAHTDSLMASAAYYLASQANRITATKSAEVGSIGVFVSGYDTSRWLKNEGVEPVVVKSVPGKAGVQSDGSLGDAERASIQAVVDDYHAMFVASVAAGRGIDLEQATAMGDGKVYVGSRALERGYVDALESREKTLKTARQLGRERAAVAASNPPAIAGTIPEDEDMPPKTTEEEVGAGAGKTKTATAPETTTTTESTAAAGAAAGDAARDERARVTAIIEASAESQADLRNKLIADGTPLTAALQALNKDLRDKLSTKVPASTTALGRGNSANTVPSNGSAAAPNDKIAAMPEGPDKWAAEWDADDELRAEFAHAGGRDDYFAYRRNYPKGHQRKVGIAD